MIARTWLQIKKTLSGFIEHEDLTRGAAIAYYTTFSIAPLLIIVIAIAGLAFGRGAAEGAIVGELSDLIGKQSAEIVQSMIQSASHQGAGILPTIIGIGTLLLTATGAFTEIQSALNAIWKAAPSGAFSELVRARLVSLGLVATLGFLMLVSLLVSAGLTALGRYMSDLFPGGRFLLSLLNSVISLVLISALFAAIYKILPDKPIAWRDVAVGSVTTAILFTGRQVPYWPLHRKQRFCIKLRGSGRATDFSLMGLLFRPDLPAWRRIHSRLRRRAREPRC